MNDSSTSTQHLSPERAKQGVLAVVERVAGICRVPFDPRSTSEALAAAQHEIGGPWARVWQHRLKVVVGKLGLRPASATLSLEECAATLRPGQSAITYRPSPANPDGWVLLVDEKRGNVFRVFAEGGQRDGWVAIDELASALETASHERLPWLLCDAVLPMHQRDNSNHPSIPPFERLRQLVRPERADLWSIVVFGLIVGGLSLTTPIAVQQLVNSVAMGGLIQPVVILAVLLMAALSFSAVLSALQAYVAEIVQRRLFVRVVADLSARLPRVRIDAFDTTSGPELVNRFFDVMTVQKVGTSLMLDGVTLSLQTIIGLLVLSFYHPAMLAFSVVLLVGIAIVVFGFGRGAINSAIAESKSKYAVANWLEEIARHVTTLKTPAATEFAREHADVLAREYLSARSSHYRIVLRQLGGALGLQVIASAALLALGGGLVIAGQLTLGQLVASELIVTVIVASFAKLGKHLEGFYDLLAAVDKLGHLFDLPLEAEGGSVDGMVDGPATLEFHKVAFGYGAEPVFKDLALKITAGESVALVGPNGSGKSALLDLALGLRNPTAGYVTVNGKDLRELCLTSLRQDVVCVRGADVVEGSIEDNIRLGRWSVTVEAIHRALEIVGLTKKVFEFPDGLQTHLCGNGVPLSRGEAVRICLARAIVGKPKLILIDEASVNLDEHASDIDLDAIFSPDAPWSLLVVTAASRIAGRCDRVVHLDSTTTGGITTTRPEDAK
ncbi:MAG: putative ABC transport system ATP-binding protein [Hyphomicrobiaceae bacterium]|jgi:putative ABC transport system ATP-binding protein